MYITEQPSIYDSKFPLSTRDSKLVSNRSVHLKIQQLEYSINTESPRTQKAMSNLGFTKLMLMRRNMTDFKLKNDEDSEMQTTNYNWHLVELKENLLAVIRERQVIIKWLLQRRIEEDQFLGMFSTAKSSNYLKKEYEIESPLSLEEKLLKIDKERIKTQQISENGSKQALLQELQRRAAFQQWELKVDRTTAAKEELVQKRRQIISDGNIKASKVYRLHKDKEQGHIENQFRQSQTFFDQFQKRDLKIQETRQQQVEQMAKRSKEAEGKIHLKKQEILQSFDVVDHNREQKGENVERRIQISRENQKMIRLQKQEDCEYNLQKVLKSAQVQESFSKLENINTYWRKMDMTTVLQAKKEIYIKEFLLDHKKYMSDKFVKQKSKLEKLKVKEEERIDELKERKEITQERMKNFEEQKVIEQNVRGDLFQQRQFKQNDLYEKNQQEQYDKEDQILQKSLSQTNKLVQKRLEKVKLQSHANSVKLKQEFFTTQQQHEIGKFKNASTGMLMEKFSSLSSVKPEDIVELRAHLYPQDKKDVRGADHKSSRSSSQQFFKK